MRPDLTLWNATAEDIKQIPVNFRVKDTNMNTNQKHSELELKWDANSISLEDFLAFTQNHEWDRFEKTSGPDVYYRQGDRVVRHRLSGGAGELTVKQRRSTRSTKDRLEIDLKFAHDTSILDVQEFLTASGWKREFTLEKTCWIYWKNQYISLVYYEVKEVGDQERRTKRFIEVEVEKDFQGTSEAAQHLLRNWQLALRRDLALGAPLNLSLYEVYSGKRYTLAKQPKR